MDFLKAWLVIIACALLGATPLVALGALVHLHRYIEAGILAFLGFTALLAWCVTSDEDGAW